MLQTSEQDPPGEEHVGRCRLARFCPELTRLNLTPGKAAATAYTSSQREGLLRKSCSCTRATDRSPVRQVHTKMQSTYFKLTGQVAYASISNLIKMLGGFFPFNSIQAPPFLFLFFFPFFFLCFTDIIKNEMHWTSEQDNQKIIDQATLTVQAE